MENNSYFKEIRGIPFKGLSAVTLKYIGIISMLCSHFYLVILKSRGMEQFQWLDMIGRLAFPIYAFFLAEGFCRTHNLKRYLQRMLIFAVLSEIPFNLAFYGKILCFDKQNIFFTFAIALCVLYFQKEEVHLAGKAVALAAGIVLAKLFHADYAILGIWQVVCFYYLNQRKQENMILLILNQAIYDALRPTVYSVQKYAGFAAVLLYFYNGERGRGNKYFFYVFYPLHLGAFFLLSVLLK